MVVSASPKAAGRTAFRAESDTGRDQKHDTGDLEPVGEHLGDDADGNDASDEDDQVTGSHGSSSIDPDDGEGNKGRQSSA